MKKGKRGQASLVISVILLVIILVVIVVALIVILMKPDLFVNFQQKEQTSTIIIKTVQETPKEPTCFYPLRQIGNTCCSDNNQNNVCDSEETNKQQYSYTSYSSSCSNGYIRDGSNCCSSNSYNKVCYSDRINRQYNSDYKSACSYGYIRDGNSCCLDDDNNDLCDMYEHHYVRYDYRDDRMDFLYSGYDYKISNPKNCYYYPESNSSQEYYRCDW